MSFDLKKVAGYAGTIGVGAKVFTQKNWADTRELVFNSFKGFERQQNLEKLKLFAQALHYAANYLMNKNVRIEKDRQEFIDKYTSELIFYYRKLCPQGDIKAPLQTLEPSIMREKSLISNYKRQQNYLSCKSSGQECTPALNDFVNSQAFKALENHLNLVLNEDNRDHSFFCFNFRESRKVNVLNQLITDLKYQLNIQDVKKCLVEFYEGKGKSHSFDNKETWNDSAFEILNTGQNITTRIFSMFGMQTTTIELIDKLAQSIGFDPHITEEIKSRDSKIFSS